MRAFVRFIIRYHFTLIFLLLQIINVVLIISYNNKQHSVFFTTANTKVASFNSWITNFNQYFSLKEENNYLLEENTSLKNQLKKNYKKNKVSLKDIQDTNYYTQRYYLLPAKVIQSSVLKENNYLTLDKGIKQGVRVGNGVLSHNGIVGVVRWVSSDYSVVLPIINKDFKVSCQLKKNHYLGSLLWAGSDCKKAHLLNIPFHVPVKKGDTLLTTGYSLVFPSGEYVGKVISVRQEKGESFYNIDVELGVNFKTLTYLYVVNDLQKPELDTLLKNIR